MTITTASMNPEREPKPAPVVEDKPVATPKTLDELDGGLTLLQFQLNATNHYAYPEQGRGGPQGLSHLLLQLNHAVGNAGKPLSDALVGFPQSGTAEARQFVLNSLGEALVAIANLVDELDESLEEVALRATV